ncbi:FAD-dependent oxidoreductase [Staphylococcus aureus]
MVGFQTHLKWELKKKLLNYFRFKNVDIVRYGVMHRNTFINSPDVLNEKYELISQPNRTVVESYLC